MDKVKLAKELLAYCTFSVGKKPLFPSKEQREAKKIFDKHDGWVMATALEAVEILGAPKTKTELELGLELLVYAGVSGNEKKIEYTNRLHGGDYIDDTPPNRRPVYDDPAYQNDVKAMQLSDMGKAYEKQDLEKALQTHFEAYKLFPGGAWNVQNITRVLNRLGRMDESIQFLNDLKQTKYYKSKYDLNTIHLYQSENPFPQIVDACLEDSIKKKERGYVYRPRKKKDEAN